MNRLHVALVALVGGLMISGGVVMAQAQDAGGNRGQRGGGQGGGNFDPAQMRQRMEERMQEQLGVNADEWKVLQPKVEKVQTLQRDSRGGMFGRGGPGGRGGDQQADSPVAKAQQELRTALENKDAPAADLAKKLTAYREAREKAKVALAAAQKELLELLTKRQEAALVVMGMLD